MNKETNIYEQILNSMIFPLIVVNQNKEVHMINSSGESFFQTSSKMIIGRSIMEFIPFSSPVISLIDNCIEKKSSYYEYNIDLTTPKTGIHKDVDIQISKIVNDSNKYQIIFLEDRYEKNFISRNKNSEDGKALSYMSALLAHEIKNPLSGIRGAAQLVEKRLEPEDREMTKLICSEVDRIKRLIDNLDVFDSSNSSELKSLNIHSILRHVGEIIKNTYGDKIIVSEAFDPSIPNVLGNEDQLIQMFLNLANNSCEALVDTTTSGRVIIKSSYEYGYTIKGVGGKKKLSLPIKISIIDNGPGIPQNITSSIFQPFVSSKRTGEGGLGLAIVNKIINDHNGVIDFETDSGGTTFIARLASARLPNE